MTHRVASAFLLTVGYLYLNSPSSPIYGPAFSLLVIGLAIGIGAVLGLVGEFGLRPTARQWVVNCALTAALCAPMALTAVGNGRLALRAPPNLSAETLSYPLLGSVMEEIAFRGLLLALLMPIGTTRAVVVSSIAFGIAHVEATPLSVSEGASRIVFAALIGCVLAAIRLLSGSLWFSSTAHYAVNMVGLVAGYGLFYTAPLSLIAAQLLLYGLAAYAALRVLRLHGGDERSGSSGRTAERTERAEPEAQRR